MRETIGTSGSNMREVIAIAVMITSLATGATAQRTPLVPVELTKIDYEPGGSRDRFNPATQQWEKVALERKITYDEASGNFLLQWNGLDGQRKTIVYRPATRLHAVVIAKVERDGSGRGLRYVYGLRNLPVSQRQLQSFYVETKAPVDAPESPDATWGYSAPFTDYLKQVFEVKEGWDWARTRDGSNGLVSGESTWGFSFRSDGLPGLVKCYVAVPPGMKGAGEEPPEELMAALDSVLWLVPKGVTVGPVNRSDKAEAIEFLAEIAAMVEVADQQGWILSPLLAGNAQRSLKSALKSLSEKRSVDAQMTLRSLLRTFEDEKNGALQPEAYALLTYNLEFLLTRIEHAN